MASPDLELSCLVPWTTIMKESHGTGTISSLRKDQRDRLDAAAAEFLEQFYEPEDVAECKVLNGKRECIGLPPALCEAFMDWLGKKDFFVAMKHAGLSRSNVGFRHSNRLGNP